MRALNRDEITELAAHLRNQGAWSGYRMEDAADALEQLLAERDAEAALADWLATDYVAVLEYHDWEEEEDGDNLPPALAAHRERRTTPTKDGNQ